MTFQELGLNVPILRALADQGYEKPTPIQEKAIPPALEGRDVLGCAQTGTGKTCAFAAPILQRLSAAPVPGRPVRALILTPTRELALQIHESFEHYGKNLPLRCAVIFGGVGQAPQVERLKRGVDILAATPGRLADLHGQGLIDLSRLEIFVLDEADRMLDMGFIHDVKRILGWLPERKQTLFFSATMPPEVQGLVDSLLHDPAKVAVDPVSSPVEVIEQKLYFVDRGNKTKLLAMLLQESGVQSALVFTRTKHGANKVAGDLIKAGISAAAIHGNKSQTARQQALADFKSGAVRVLVATDIAARGLDIEELPCVFNYNLPDVPETYVHRIGRTGRAGRGGMAFSFCDVNEKDELKGIEKLLGRKLPVEENHPWPMQVLEPAPKDKKGRTVNPEDAEARAAARERRQARNAEKTKAKAEQPPKQAAPRLPAEQPPKQAAPKPPAEQPPKQAAPKPPAEQPQKKARGRRASATLEEALTATAPRQQAKQKNTSAVDFQRPDPLASDVIMDATARLLAPRPRAGRIAPPPAAPAKARRPKAPKPQAQAQAQAKPQPERAPVPRKKRGQPRDRGRGSRPPEVTLRSGSQKDSTEQPSLMKPYYLSDD